MKLNGDFCISPLSIRYFSKEKDQDISQMSANLQLKINIYDLKHLLFKFPKFRLFF